MAACCSPKWGCAPRSGSSRPTPGRPILPARPLRVIRWELTMLTRSSCLQVKVFAAREEAGNAGAAIAAEVIHAEIARAGKAAVIFASAVSQDPFLAALR